MRLLILLIYTLVFVFAQGTFIFFFMKMIAPNGMLDVLFKWQRMLEWCFGHKYKAVQLLGKALGDCDMCTCFWAAVVSFFTYRWLAISLGMQIITGWQSLIWFWLYVVITGWYSLWFITKMKNDGL